MGDAGRGGGSITITLTFSEADMDTLDTVARTMRRTRDQLLADIMGEGIREWIADVVKDFNKAIAQVERRGYPVRRGG